MTTDIEPAAGLRGVGVRLPEIGRIRYGIQVPVIDKKTGEQGKDKYGRPKTYPKMLETWRLTTTYAPAAEAAANLWGGDVAPWTGGRGEQWEVITTTASLPVIIPAGRIISQAYEQWDGAEQLRSCNGQWDSRSGEACDCPFDLATGELDDDANCEPATHLTVLLPGVPGWGSWRLVSHGRNAARKLAGVAALMRQFGTNRTPTEATLVLVQRSAKVAGQTRRWAEPMLMPAGSAGDAARELIARQAGNGNGTAAQVEQVARPELTSSAHTSEADAAPVPVADANGDTALMRTIKGKGRRETVAAAVAEAYVDEVGAEKAAETADDLNARVRAARSQAQATMSGEETPPAAGDMPDWLAVALERAGCDAEWARGVLIDAGFGFLAGSAAGFGDIAGGDQGKALQALRAAWAAEQAERNGGSE